MTFDTPINRIGSHSSKWDSMEKLFGISPTDGLAMWVADMDFRPPTSVQRSLQAMLDHGIYGYYGDLSDYHAAIIWWMKTRHDWTVRADQIFTTHGLVNGTAICLEAFTKPGDGIILMTPVYHAFARVIKAAGREVVECRLQNNDGRYELDLQAWDAQLTGKEKMLILCSPHNPGGRVWTQTELLGIADFCKRNDLLLISDEIHHDLVMPGHKHIATGTVEGIEDRLVVMTSTSKTFNLAGGYTGNVIIADPDLRARFAAKMAALGVSPNSFGLAMTVGAYTPEGATWVDALTVYLAENARIFNEGMRQIPGVQAMDLEATYLCWVDFSGTGMAPAEFIDRVQNTAKIAPNHGATFGAGGETFLRFNIGTQRANVTEAVARLQQAFADLQ